MNPKSKVIPALAVALCVTAGCAAFPPRQASGLSRILLFGSDYEARTKAGAPGNGVDAGRLLAEVLLVWCLCGLLLLYWSCD